jgi:Holliday junction resolvase RusA-like endonuclease
VTAVEIVVHGTPTGKARPRFDTRTGRAFTPKRTVLAEGRVHDAWVNAGCPRVDGPVLLTVDVVLARPAAHFRADGTFSAAGRRSAAPTKKPDWDNIAKLVGDALNGCAYRDDADVVRAVVTKRWTDGRDDPERTLIRVESAPASDAA